MKLTVWVKKNDKQKSDTTQKKFYKGQICNCIDHQIN